MEARTDSALCPHTAELALCIRQDAASMLTIIDALLKDVTDDTDEAGLRAVRAMVGRAGMLADEINRFHRGGKDHGCDPSLWMGRGDPDSEASRMHIREQQGATHG